LAKGDATVAQNNQSEEILKRWQLLMPPARPSKGMVSIYDRALFAESMTGDPTWGLLGCTPEIRSLAGKYQRKLLCIDKDPHIYSALLSKCQPSAAEEFLLADWLEATIPPMFDILIGDGSITMLPLPKHEVLIYKIHQLLKPQGLALLRVHMTHPALFKSAMEIIDWYRTTHADKPLYLACKIYFDLLLMDPKTLNVNPADYKNQLQQLHDDGKITSAELDSSLHKHVRSQLYYSTRERFEQTISPYFAIEGVHYPEDFPGHTSTPIYQLRKKG
jgi:hypothetical protein